VSKAAAALAKARDGQIIPISSICKQYTSPEHDLAIPRLRQGGSRLGHPGGFFGLLEVPQWRRPSRGVFDGWFKLDQLWKITVFNGKIHYHWPFSIAMVNYQRVQSTGLQKKYLDSQKMSKMKFKETQIGC
jgi:hypothetical protein